jgi:protein involved in polysaccharide export with SLBB domain
MRMTPRRPFRAVLSAALLTFALSACADDPGPTPANFKLSDAPNALGRSYRIGVGDKLKLSVFGEENLSGPIEVNALGNVSLPLAGDIPAQGLTLAQLREGIIRRLSDGFLKNPRVTLEIASFRPIYVHGEVKSGGEFAYKASLNMRDAIATAGGFTYRANQNYVYVTRDGQPEVKVGMSGNIPVMPGDNIRIPERFF